MSCTDALFLYIYYTITTITIFKLWTIFVIDWLGTTSETTTTSDDTTTSANNDDDDDSADNDQSMWSNCPVITFQTFDDLTGIHSKQAAAMMLLTPDYYYFCSGWWLLYSLISYFTILYFYKQKR